MKKSMISSYYVRGIIHTGMLLAVLGITACGGTLPETGPSANAVKNTPNVDIVDVTADLAHQMVTEEKEREFLSISSAFNKLNTSDVHIDHVINVGDDVQVNLWTITSSSSKSSDSAGGSGPSSVSLGTFSVATDGTIDLPYIQKIRLIGLTDQKAQEYITHRYEKLGVFENPSVTIKVSGSSKDSIIVTGAIGEPRILPWSAGGITLPEAITLALGNGDSSLGADSNLDNNRPAVTISVLRGNQGAITLPISTALESQIPLHPADRIIVRKQSAVQVTVLGGGIEKNGTLGFPNHPSLAEVVAQASGLNSGSANNRHMYIFRHSNGKKPVLYDFGWNKGEALVAAQEFPLENDDIVYVAEAGIVPITRILNLIFQLSIPASIAR